MLKVLFAHVFLWMFVRIMWLGSCVTSVNPSSKPFTNFKRDPSCAQVIFCTWPKCAVANLARTWPTFRVRANLQNTSKNCRRHHQLLSFLVWNWSFLWDICVFFCAVYRNVQYAKHLSFCVSFFRCWLQFPQHQGYSSFNSCISTRKSVFYSWSANHQQVSYSELSSCTLAVKEAVHLCLPSWSHKGPILPSTALQLAADTQTDYILFTSVHICFKL